MINKINLIIIIFLFCINAKSQDSININTTNYHYWSGLTNKNYTIKTVQIENNSNEDYITWLALDSVEGKVNKQLIGEYFLNIKGDFSLFDIMSEGLFFDQPIAIGYTFLKKIKPKESFQYIAIYEKEKNDLLKDRIVLMKEYELITFYNIVIDEKYYYQNKELILTD